MMFIASKQMRPFNLCFPLLLLKEHFQNVLEIERKNNSVHSKNKPRNHLRSRLTHYPIDNRSYTWEIGTKEYTIELPVKLTSLAARI
jgi:hypothetical protein